jgi:hypothetical protein
MTTARERLEQLRNTDARCKEREAQAIQLLEELMELTITLQRAVPRVPCGPEDQMCACTGACQYMHAEVSDIHTRITDFIYSS